MATKPGVDAGPTPAECQALVQRILASKEFLRANRLREFLVYVVSRKLEGSPRELTEGVIGHRVFGRAADYNPADDSIVRTEARILRQRLEHYFAEPGREEQLVLEIPKGCYVPVFRHRDPAGSAAPVPRLIRLRLWLVLGVCVLIASAVSWYFAAASSRSPAPAASSRSAGLVELDSSDPRLVNAFQWAKQRALSYAYTGDAVGDWYDSTAGDRYAFCMRDASHQSLGAAVLGLTGHTRNMFRRFAASISASRNWCGFWEINKDGFPAPIDYRDDSHFWYCLPANFDLMQACYRQFLWTGDRTYFDSVFSNFYDRTVTDYVAAWGRNRQGVMESSPAVRPRGIPSYYQEEPRPEIGADLVAAQYKGYLVYAAIQEQKGTLGSLSRKLSEEYLEKAQALRTLYNAEWWDPARNRFYSLLLPDRTYYSGYVADANTFGLLFGVPTDGRKTEAALDCLEKNRPAFDQTLSYFPEILFQYGRNGAAYHHLLELAAPDFRSREMPEVVFAIAGAVVTGLAGVSPDAPHNTLETLSRLPKEAEWVRLSRLPILANEVAIYHHGTTETTVTNQAGPPFQWKAAFSITSRNQEPLVTVDGVAVSPKIEQRANQQLVELVTVNIPPGQTRTVRCAGCSPSSIHSVY
jgi:hypothetical protein